jgi:Fic family protein
LKRLLIQVYVSADPWVMHVEFEKLHPFMDGNGRTGRAIWVWHMLRCGRKPFEISFLHRFYYQTLAAS